MIRTTLLALALTSQSPPAWRENLPVVIDGKATVVKGWKGADGTVYYFPHEQPQKTASGKAPPDVVGPLPEYATHGVAQLPVGEPKIKAESREARKFAMETAVDGADDDDGDLIHLTVIGTEAEQEKVIHDFKTHPALAPFRGKVAVQGYKPSHWAVKGIYPAGSPAILIQSEAPGRKTSPVLWRAEDYAGGPAKLAEELRRANPSYDPSLDPGAGGKQGKCPFGFTKNHRWAVIVAGVLLAFLLLSKPKGASNAS